MNKLFKLIALLAFTTTSLLQLGMHETGELHFILRLQLSNYPTQMKQLQSMEFDIAGVDLNQKTVDIVANAADVQRVQTLGIKVVHQTSLTSKAAPDQEYQTAAEVYAFLKKYETAYPSLAQVKSIGKSLEGRDIWAIKITKNVQTLDPSKPVIFFNGMHHAREVMSVEVPLDTIEVLLTGYGKDSKVTHWVDSNEIWVLPMFNVDGNNIVWSKNNMWRKNSRGGYGVDINRNYPYAWNTCNGSSGSTYAQDYRGPSAGSEPETQVMTNFVKNIRPVFSISYHSYSEILIYPYGCEGQHTPTREVVEGIGQEVANAIITDDGSRRYKAGTAPELLYAVDGGDLDWLYHEAQVIPYVIEVNSSGQGFQPSYQKWRQSTVSRVRPGWQLLLDKLDGSGIHGKVLTTQGQAVKDASIKIVRTSGGAAFTQTYWVSNHGHFTIILPSGQYQVTFQGSGLETISQSISIGKTRVEVTARLKKR